MKASVVDLRYKMSEVLKSLKRNEDVEILYHGKTAGIIMPVRRKPTGLKVREHPFFGMSKKSQTKKSVERAMSVIRGGRYESL